MGAGRDRQAASSSQNEAEESDEAEDDGRVPTGPKKEMKKKWATPDRSTSSCWRVEILRV